MIEVHSYASRLESIQHTLASTLGMLGLMQSDGSIPASWQSQVALKCNDLGVAVLDVIELRKENGETSNEQTTKATTSKVRNS